ncbi:MAG: hypothetical protein OHK0031_03050 [Anaerolineales bacterium]
MTGRKFIRTLALIFFLLTGCAPAAAPTAAPPSPPPTPTATRPPAFTPNPNYQTSFAWFYKPPAEELWPLLPQRYNFFILTHHDEPEREALRALGANQPFYEYLLLAEIQDPGGCAKTPNGNQVAFREGDFCAISAEHPDWFLLDSFGQRISSDGYYAMDPGNAEFRAFWLERATEIQLSQGWDGIFLDNVEASLSKYQKEFSLPQRYLSDASLQAAVAGFLVYLRAENFPPQKRPLYGNIISLRDSAVWLNYLSYLDGAMLENFATDWRGSRLSPGEFAAEVEMLRASQALNKKLILVSQGDEQDAARQQFAYAAYLLVNEGSAVFRYAHHSAYRQPWWYDNYALDLGHPITPALEKDGIWTREFEKGQVTLNPANGTAQILVK